jgi:hypothetical protein
LGGSSFSSGFGLGSSSGKLSGSGSWIGGCGAQSGPGIGGVPGKGSFGTDMIRSFLGYMFLKMCRLAPDGFG